ncbi:MAG: hypothetical protein GX221_08180 [Candidatus Riflebacteria bacterium]|nr:hypothetical protein [Candidatus Riflebacteria bacterium]
MDYIFKMLEFRKFFYEEDPEAITDMHYSAEALEGSWFDSAVTCQMHSKIVTDTPGSTWIVSYKGIVFAHADLIKNPNSEGAVFNFRIHTDYRYPQVTRIMLNGLKEEAKKRECSSLIIYSDHQQVEDAMAHIGAKPDRTYAYSSTHEIYGGKLLRNERVVLHKDDISNMNLYSFIGLPLPPHYLLNRAYSAADYAVFSFQKPVLYRVTRKGQVFYACFDGREWFVFKDGDFKIEDNPIPDVLCTLHELQPGYIMLSEKAAELASTVPVDAKRFRDYYCPL